MFSKILLIPFLSLSIVGGFNEYVHEFDLHEHTHESHISKKYSNTSALKFSSTLSPTYKIGSKNNTANYILSDYSDIGSLQLELFFDASIISINDIYTNGHESFKDIAIGESSVKITLLYSEQVSELNILNIDFNVIAGKNNENTVVDLVINEAYTSDQKPLSIQGCRNSIKLVEDTTEFSFISYYINSNNTDLKKGDTFNIDLRIENCKENLIKSGLYTINYDPSILELVSYEKGLFLLESNALFEINANIPGIVNFNYVTTENHYSDELMKFTFKNKINENSSSVIELVPNSLVDSYGNKVISNKTQLRFNTFYNKYSGNEELSLISEILIDEKLGSVKMIFSLPKNPFISAGDYKINFDNNKLKFDKGIKQAASEYFDFINLNSMNSSSGELILNLVRNNSKLFDGAFYEIYFNFLNKCENINSNISINGTDIYDSELIKVPDYHKIFSVETFTLSHVLGEWEFVTNATCTTDGLKVQKCTVCDEIINSEVIKSIGHSYGDWIIDKDSTCNEEGSKHKECSTCGDVINETIPKREHSGKWVVTKEPTCLENGEESLICEHCGRVLETKPLSSKGHTLGEWEIVTNATCTTDGLKVQKCTVCDEIINSEVIKSIGHSYGDWIIDKDSTCNEEGSKHKECSTCGDVINETIPKREHSGKWVVTKEPTENEEGVESLICEHCEEVIETRPIPKLPNQENTTTGINVVSSIVGGVILILITLLTLILVKKKKSKKN